MKLTLNENCPFLEGLVARLSCFHGLEETAKELFCVDAICPQESFQPMCGSFVRQTGLLVVLIHDKIAAISVKV